MVVGGSAEMRQSHPNRIRLVLKNRKGFIKVALSTGTDLGERFYFKIKIVNHELFFLILSPRICLW